MNPREIGTTLGPEPSTDGMEPKTTSVSDRDQLFSSSALAQSLFSHGFTLTRSRSISKVEALRWAVKKSLAQLVQQLLDEEADVNGTDEDDWTSLHFAAQYAKSPEIMGMLLTAGVNVDIISTSGSTALHTATRTPDPDAVRLLVTHGLNLEARTHSGMTPLHIAAAEGCIKSIEILLDAKANIECEEHDEWTPLHFACTKGHIEAVRLLVGRGADLSCVSNLGRTPLHMAVHRVWPEILKFLVSSGANTTATDNDKRTALHLAGLSDSVAATEVLLSHNVDIEARDKDGETPLATAVIHNAVQIAGLLIKNKANIEAATDAGDKPLHLAATHNFQQMMRLLIENGADVECRDLAGVTPLLRAAQKGNAEIIRCLATHGANVTATSIDGNTAIHLAVPTQNKPLIRFLIEHGVSVNVKAHETGDTALMAAARAGNPEMVSLLIQKSADVNAANSEGYTPLHYAARDGHEQVVEILLDNGANPISELNDHGVRPRHFSDVRGHDSITRLLSERTPVTLEAINESKAQSAFALIFAAKTGQVERVMEIIDDGVSINLLDIDGRSALSVAAEHGHQDLVLALVNRGVDRDLSDANGCSPLWWASRYGHDAVIEILLDHGASIDTPDTDGQSPLSVASQHGHLASVKMLLGREADPDSSTGYGITPLLFAVATCQPDMAELLLKHGADPNCQTLEGDTPLSLAEEKGYKKLANIIKAAPEYYATNSEEGTTSDNFSDSGSFLSSSTMNRKYSSMLSKASRKGRLAEIDRLIEAGADPEGYGDDDDDDETPLFVAASNGQVDAVEALIEHGADIFHPRQRGRTALMAAAREGHVSVIKLLHHLADEFDLEIDSRSRPLLEAARNGHKDTTALLLELGTTTEWKNPQGCTALWCAASNGHKAVVELLLVHGANMECANKDGVTPLMAAVIARDRAVTRLLLEKGAQMRPDSVRNFSPLCHAAIVGDEAIVDLLLDYGADLNYASDHKQTPLHLAARCGKTMVIKMLIEAGAKVDVQDANGRTALSLAKEKPHESAVKILHQARSLRQASQRAARKAEQRGLKDRARYQYRILTKPDSIRVLELHPGKPGDIIHFDLNEVQLTTDASFEALSYEWLEKVGTVPVQCNDARLCITPNCKAAMERLRLESSPRYLWIDAICINQEDNQERSQQVAMMTDIYGAARTVLMWLGEETQSTPAVFEALPMMAKAHDLILEATGELSLHALSVGEEDDPRQHVKRLLEDKEIVDAFSNLIRCTYWTRAWIFQEIIHGGSRGLAICGSHHCQWTVLERALLLSMKQRGTPFSTPLYFINYVEKNRLKGDQISLGQAALTLSSLDATDPRDKVFASLGLASASKMSSIEWPVADYTMSVQEVYVHAARYIITVDEIAVAWSLGIQRRNKSVRDLPSWVPDWKPRKDMLMVNPFPNSNFLFKLDIMEKCFTTTSSLHVDGCIIDKVVFKLTIAKKYDAYSMLLPTIQALARQNCSIYDTYPFGKKLEQSEYKVEGLTSKRCEQLVPKCSNARALFSTLLDVDLSSFDGETTTVDEFYDMMLGFLTWSLSKDKKTPDQSREAPTYAQQASEGWAAKADDEDNYQEFTLLKLRAMEDMLRYDHDLVYTESGLFALTDGGQAEEGMSIALISNSDVPHLLTRDEEGGYYQYVDVVYFNCLGESIDRLERICKNPKIERLELR